MFKNLWLPEEYIKEVLPKGFFKSASKYLTRGAKGIKKILLRALITATTLSGKEIKESLGKVVDFYQKKIDKLKDEHVKKPVTTALNNEKLLKSRVENLVTWNEAMRLKEERKGQHYIWLPSSSETPRPEHQLRYGEIFTVGDGIFPGEEYGCKCGALFIDDDVRENLTAEQQKQLEEMK